MVRICSGMPSLHFRGPNRRACHSDSIYTAQVPRDVELQLRIQIGSEVWRQVRQSANQHVQAVLMIGTLFYELLQVMESRRHTMKTHAIGVSMLRMEARFPAQVSTSKARLAPTSA